MHIPIGRSCIDSPRHPAQMTSGKYVYASAMNLTTHSVHNKPRVIISMIVKFHRYAQMNNTYTRALAPISIWIDMRDSIIFSMHTGPPRAYPQGL